MNQGTPSLGSNTGSSATNNTNSNSVDDKIQGVQRNANLSKAAHAEEGKRSVGPGLRADDYKSGKASALKAGQRNNGGSSSSLLNNNATRNINGSARRANRVDDIVRQAKIAAAKEGLKAAGQSFGIPTQLTEKALNTSAGQAALEKAIDGGNPKEIAKDLVKNMKPKSEKSDKEKSEEKEKEQKESGTISGELSIKTIKKLVIITPIIAVLMMFVLIVTSALNDSKVASMVLGELTSENRDQVVKDFDTGKGPDDSKFPREYYDRLGSLGNNFSTQGRCQGDECYSTDEFLYYLKVADIALRYQNKYHVDLDWALIVATNLYFDNDAEIIMKNNLSGYDKDKVEDYTILSELDWDTDFKNMAGYDYLDPADSRYDLNILAKNMVTKRTIQTCSSGGTVVKRQEDIDIEDIYFAENGKNRLVCGSGQAYSINSSYTKDLDKYDEFLLEYIDKRLSNKTNKEHYYSNSEYMFPLPSDRTYSLTSPFGYRIHPIRGTKEFHNGTDFGAPGGTPVYAIADGKVILARNGYNGGAGNYIKVDHGNGVISVYMHSSKLLVSEGQSVKKGDTIMLVGTTGASTGNHLHIGVTIDGAYVDPVSLFGTSPQKEE